VRGSSIREHCVRDYSVPCPSPEISTSPRKERGEVEEAIEFPVVS